MIMEAICIGVALSSMIVAGVSLTMACICWSKVVGLEKSTHQVQFVPMEDAKGEAVTGETLDKQMKEAFSEEAHDKEYI